MKYTLSLLLCFFMIFNVHSQTEDTRPPYEKFPTFPPAKLLLPDGVSYYTKDDLPKKKAVLLILFNPGCEHCQHETEEIIKHIDEFKDIHIVMVTPMPYDTMMVFRKKYQLERFNNIVVTQDAQFFMPTFFSVSSLPYLAFYNGKKEFIDIHQGSLPIPAILEMFKKAD